MEGCDQKAKPGDKVENWKIGRLGLREVGVVAVSRGERGEEENDTILAKPGLSLGELLAKQRETSEGAWGRLPRTRYSWYDPLRKRNGLGWRRRAGDAGGRIEGWTIAKEVQALMSWIENI